MISRIWNWTLFGQTSVLSITMLSMLSRFNLLLLCVISNFLILFIFRTFNVFNELLFEQILLVSFLICVSLILWQRFKSKRLMLDTLVFILFSTTFSIFVVQSTIINVDRSRSFYVLSWTDKDLVSYNGETLDLSKVSSDEKLGLTGVETRINEQISRGLISRHQNELALTNQGRIYLFIANTLAKIYSLENWENNKY